MATALLKHVAFRVFYPCLICSVVQLNSGSQDFVCS
uniref:Uncharacterized protein n=1 Tax=Anguilla anguilla TaxID=7936 RepID=A0A0E9WIH7_ANGAN